MVVLQEAGIFLEQLALLRILDIGLEFHSAVLARVVEQRVQHLQIFEVELLGKRARQKHCYATLTNADDDGQLIGDEHRAQGGATNDQEFGGLQKHHQVAMLHQITAYYSADDYDNPDDCK